MEYLLKTPINGANRISVHTDVPLGKGATATVYRASVNGAFYAAKIYTDKRKLNLKKIEAMISNPPTGLMGMTAGINYPRYSWPISIIEDHSGQAIGYAMPIVDQRESFTLDHYYDKNLGKKLNSPDEVALSYKIEIAANLSRLIAYLHSHGHYFIDFKPQNIRVFKRTHAVTLIDCDGFSIANPSGQSFPAELLSTDYISPEAFRGHQSAKELSEDQDRYALATIIFQLLNGGIHPFQGITTGEVAAATNDEKAAQGLYPHGFITDPRIKPRPQSIHNCFDDATRQLFDRAFKGRPTERPSAQEWGDHLSEILANKQLTRCDQHPYDIRHMRFLGKECPECFLHKLKTTKPTPEKSSVKLPPITSDSFSSPMLTTSPTGMDPGVKAMLIGLGLAILFAAVLGYFMSGKTSNNSYDNSSKSSSASSISVPRASVTYTPQEMGKYESQINSIHSSSDSKTVTYTPGATVVWKAGQLVGLGWRIIQAKEADYYKLGFKVNKEAYELGHPEGASNMGYMYEYGMGVPQSYENAASWYQRAINMGKHHSAQAEIHLGQLYQHGKLGKPDLNKARQLYGDAIIQAGHSNWSFSKAENLRVIQENLDKISQSTAVAAVSSTQSPPPVAAAPNGYASIYFDPKSSAFSWATGYGSQDTADSSAKSSCEQRGATGPCKKFIGGPFKCVAVSQGGTWFNGALADSLGEAESKAKAGCEKVNIGGSCYIPAQGSSCAKLKEKSQSESQAKPKSTVEPAADLAGWIRAVYPQYGYIEMEFPLSVYLYSGQILTSASGKKYRVSKINGRYASLEPLDGTSVVQYEHVNSTIYK